MSFTFTYLLLSMIVGSVGFVLFRYGRKQARWPHIVAGLLMMAYPIFTPTVLSLVIVGLLIGAGLWEADRQGW
jgi:sulfite exporter TauE/SafE